MPDNSVDSIVTDPPYGLSFIGCEMSPEYLAIAQARIQHEVDKIEAANVPAPQLDMFA